MQHRSPFSKHLWNLVSSGFYTRGLDSDDLEFLRSVERNGIANGSLPNTGHVLLDELEFWQAPYRIAPHVPRKWGPIPKAPKETPEQRVDRTVRSNTWHARRAVLLQERKLTAIELEAEYKRWQREQAGLLHRAALADAEWEAAAPGKKGKKTKPGKLPFGRVVCGHYIPQWKVDEIAADEATQAAEAEAIRLKRVQAEIDLEAAKAKEAEARKAAQALKPAAMTKDDLKKAVLALIRGTTRTWGHDEIMRATGCHDLDFLKACIDEMAKSGAIVYRYNNMPG